MFQQSFHPFTGWSLRECFSSRLRLFTNVFSPNSPARQAIRPTQRKSLPNARFGLKYVFKDDKSFPRPRMAKGETFQRTKNAGGYLRDRNVMARLRKSTS